MENKAIYQHCAGGKDKTSGTPSEFSSAIRLGRSLRWTSVGCALPILSEFLQRKAVGQLQASVSRCRVGILPGPPRKRQEEKNVFFRTVQEVALYRMKYSSFHSDQAIIYLRSIIKCVRGLQCWTAKPEFAGGYGNPRKKTPLHSPVDGFSKDREPRFRDKLKPAPF